MGSDNRKRQKKLERRAAKRKAKHHEITRQKHAGLPERLTDATKYPVLHSWATDDLWKEGMGWVLLSRELPDGSIAFAIFLVDRYCLGVKNVTVDIADRLAYEDNVARKMQSEYTIQELTPATVRKFVEGAVDYAHNLGLYPHADYQRGKLIFGDIDPTESPDELEYGKDGKPFFFAGPFDTPRRCRQIMTTLEERVGRDGFHFLIPYPETGEVFTSEPLDEEEEYEEED